MIQILRFTRRSVYLYSYIQPYIHLCDTFTNEKVQKFQRIHFLVENRINVNDVLAHCTGQIIIFYTSWVLLFSILHLRIEVLIFPCCWMMNLNVRPVGLGFLGMLHLFCILMHYQDVLNYCVPIFGIHIKDPRQSVMQTCKTVSAVLLMWCE